MPLPCLSLPDTRSPAACLPFPRRLVFSPKLSKSPGKPLRRLPSSPGPPRGPVKEATAGASTPTATYLAGSPGRCWPGLRGCHSDQIHVGEEVSDENKAERWQDREAAPPRRQAAGPGRQGAGAGAQVTDGGGGGRVRN